MAELPWIFLLQLLGVLVAGVIAGFVNSVAGGGSFLTLPALMLCGLDIHVANGTNRVAVLAQSITATSVFLKSGKTDQKAIRRLAIPIAIGAITGAFVAAYLNATYFKYAFGVIMLVMAVVVIMQPKIMLASERKHIESAALEWMIYLGIGMYAGFIQAGTGILMLVAMRMFTANDLVNSNGVKNALNLILTVGALSVFIWHDQVNWGYGVLLAVGQVVGAYWGAHSAIKHGAKLVFVFVVGVMVLTGISMLWPAMKAAWLMFAGDAAAA